MSTQNKPSDPVAAVVPKETKKKKTPPTTKKTKKLDSTITNQKLDSKIDPNESKAPVLPDHSHILALQCHTLQELQTKAQAIGITDYRQLKKDDLIFKILQSEINDEATICSRGILEILPDGYGFLRTSNYLPNKSDIYVSQTQIRRFSLASGDIIYGQIRPPKDNERYYSLLRVQAINWDTPDQQKKRNRPPRRIW